MANGYVEEGLNQSNIREYIMENFGEEAFDEDGNIKEEYLRRALRMAQDEPDEVKQTLIPGIRAELAMSPSQAEAETQRGELL